MIIVLQPGATEAQIEHVVERVRNLGFDAHLSRGTYRTIIGVIGDETKLQAAPLAAISGVAQVLPILPPFKLASSEAHPEPSVVSVRGVKIGGGNLGMIAGPCAIESRERLDEIAASVRKSGANILRGGAFKPRTSPYDFQGLGEEGLKYLAEAREITGLPIITEVMTVEQVPLVTEYADILQIGARNMQNYGLLNAVGKVDKPVMLKRGMSGLLKELLLCAEYIASNGNYKIMLCERGIRTYETATRNTFDLNAVPVLKQSSHLPVVADPSHGTGYREYVPAMAKASVAAGADALIIEVHTDPDKALSDGRQTISVADFAKLVHDLRRIAEAVDRTVAEPEAEDLSAFAELEALA